MKICIKNKRIRMFIVITNHDFYNCANEPQFLVIQRFARVITCVIKLLRRRSGQLLVINNPSVLSARLQSNTRPSQSLQLFSFANHDNIYDQRNKVSWHPNMILFSAQWS